MADKLFCHNGEKSRPFCSNRILETQNKNRYLHVFSKSVKFVNLILALPTGRLVTVVDGSHVCVSGFNVYSVCFRSKDFPSGRHWLETSGLGQQQCSRFGTTRFSHLHCSGVYKVVSTLAKHVVGSHLWRLVTGSGQAEQDCHNEWVYFFEKNT